MLIQGHNTGALFRPPSPQNYSLLDVQEIGSILRAGVPPSYLDLLAHCPHVYNQGSIPSCVCHAMSACQTGNEHIERKGEVMVFDAQGMHQATGPVNQGRYAADILKYAQDVGVPLLNSTKRYRIGTYAFAPTSSPEAWIDTVKATLVSGRFVMVCSMLWSNFGWDTSGSVLGPGSYHEYLIVGYTPDPAPYGSGRILNSWGESWGRGGFGNIPFSRWVENNFQGGFVIANSVTDAIDGDLSPAPKPPDPSPNPPVSDVAEVLRLTNEARAKAGLKPLALLPSLTKAAQDFAQWMGANNKYGHNADGKQPIERMIAAGLPASGWSNWGENIAAGQTAPGDSNVAVTPIIASAMRDGKVLAGVVVGPGGVFTDWMNSPSHKANILFPAFTHIGIGHAVVPGSQYVNYWVQEFVALSGTPDPGPKPPDPTPWPPDPKPPEPNPPDPNPPDPNPPTPGELTVACDSAGPALYAWASLNGVPTLCNFRGTLGGEDLTPTRSTSRYPYRAVWTRANPAGKSALIQAVTLDGTKSGSVSRQF